MKVRCIKSISNYNGSLFTKGKEYKISLKKRDIVDLITNIDLYRIELQAIVNNEKEPQKDKYIISVPIKLVDIMSDDMTQAFTFCKNSRKYILKKYKTNDFRYSLMFFEDFFIDISKERQNKINKILD